MGVAPNGQQYYIQANLAMDVSLLWQKGQTSKLLLSTWKEDKFVFMSSSLIIGNKQLLASTTHHMVPFLS